MDIDSGCWNFQRIAWRISACILLLGYLKSAECGSQVLYNDDESLSRSKRQLPLVYPRGSTTKLILAYSLPMENPLNVTLGFASGFQYQFQEPQNSTMLTRYYPFMTARERTRRDVKFTPAMCERGIFYKALEMSMDRVGLDGKYCLLRTICESAEAPVNENGLIGEILHIVLTPMFGIEDSVDNPKNIPEEYLEAYRYGLEGNDCAEKYYQCPQGEGIFDMISYLSES